MNRICVVFITVLFFLYAAASSVFALPEGESIESGNATFETPNPTTLNITASDKAVINFNSFNIAQNEAVHFFQPCASASVLSRVTGPSPSEIYGTLTANGTLYLVNPSGIHFGPEAQVHVNNLIASTLAIDTNNFVNGCHMLEKMTDVRRQTKWDSLGMFFSCDFSPLFNHSTIKFPSCQ